MMEGSSQHHKSAIKRTTPPKKSDEKAVKSRKLLNTEELMIPSHELYTLPKSVLRKPTPHTKAKSKKIPAKQTISKMREGSYMAMRKEREEFRKKLVNLILKKEGGDTSYDDSLSAEEKEVLRYYYYIHHGIDTVHVPPLEDEWIRNIQTRIPNKLKKWGSLIEDTIAEVKEDFILNMKKAVVDFVLQDPTEGSNKMKEFDSPHRQELKEMSKTWHAAHQDARSKIYKNLHAINPCLSQILDLWHKSFNRIYKMTFPSN